jgi:hypothetical protein
VVIKIVLLTNFPIGNNWLLCKVKKWANNYMQETIGNHQWNCVFLKSIKVFKKKFKSGDHVL